MATTGVGQRRLATRPTVRDVSLTGTFPGVKVADSDPSRTYLAFRVNGGNNVSLKFDQASTLSHVILTTGTAETSFKEYTKQANGDLVTLEWWAFNTGGLATSVVVTEWWGQG